MLPVSSISSQSRDVGLLDGEEARPSAEVVLQGHGVDLGPYPRGTFRRVLGAMATLVAAIVATYVVPPLHFARPWTSKDPVVFWNIIGREFLGDEPQADEKGQEQLERAQALAEAAQREAPEPVQDKVVVAAPREEDLVPAYAPHDDDAEPIPQALALTNPEALDAFFARLTRSDLAFAGAVTRVSHWGDSVIASDNVTSTLRETMQRRFGDSGHGFHLIAPPTASYRHRAIRFSDGDAWSRCYIINDCKKDGHYGFGGTTVWSAGGARSKFATAKDSPNGLKASLVELWFAAEPRGGDVRVTIDDETPHVVQTGADAGLEDRWARFEVADGPHAFEIRASGGGKARLYGVVLERDQPGVVWDGLAQLGAFSSRMLNFDAAHLQRQVAHRDPGLLVFQFGGNDLLLKASQLSRYTEQFREMLQRFRGNTTRPCLVVSPVDHGQREGGRIESVAMMPAITEAQRTVALAEGCAFFDTRAAMGGDHSVARWRRNHPPLISGDLAHLTDAGQQVLGRMIYLALMERYRDYRERVAGQPVATLAAASEIALPQP